MELTGETLEAIGRYVRGNLGAWIREINLDRDIELRERTVRVEEELKAQRELMREGSVQLQCAVFSTYRLESVARLWPSGVTYQ